MTIFDNLDVNVSLVSPTTPAQKKNINNLVLFTTEQLLDGDDDYRFYRSASNVNNDYGTSSKTYKITQSVFSDLATTPYIGNGFFAVVSMQENESLADAILRIEEKLLIGSIITDKSLNAEEIIEVAELVQSKYFFYYYSLDVDDCDGFIAEIVNKSLSYTRIIGQHGSSEIEAQKAVARSVAVQCSVNYSGTRTALSMHAKQLIGISTSNINNTQRVKYENSGADVYINQNGVGSYRESRANNDWSYVLRDMNQLQIDIQYATSRALARTNTKIPQDQEGLDSIIDAIIPEVLNQYVVNGVLTRGLSWNGEILSPINPIITQKQINQNGWYVYAQPMIEQNEEDRLAGKTTPITIFAKNSRAIRDVTISIKYE